MTETTRILVALPAGPVAAWRALAVRELRCAGARVKIMRTPAAAETPRAFGPVAATIFVLEKHWSSQAPTGLEPAPEPDSDPFEEPADIRISLAGDRVFEGHPPALGDWVIGFPDTRDPLDSARRAVLENRPVARVRLRRRFPDGTKDRFEGAVGVNPHSATDTLRTTVALAAVMPARILRGWRPAEIAPDEPGPRRATGATAHLSRLLREAFRDAMSRKQWRILIRCGAADAKPVPCPADRIQADPFVVEAHGETRVFFEEMTFGEKRGYIMSARLDGDTLTDPRPALATDHHLSYPQVFDFGGRLRLTVESARSGEVRLYDCERWPDAWAPGPVLMRLPMIDPSLFEHEGRWWLIGNLPPAPGAKADGELHVFHSADPLSGDWIPHAQNPVVCDARFARGAGRPFLRDGRLIRPAQDCAGGYGRRVVLREIRKLTPEVFEETTVGDIPPPPGAVALHTLNGTDRLTVLDEARRRLRLFS